VERAVVGAVNSWIDLLSDKYQYLAVRISNGCMWMFSPASVDI
jgi:hypothetical protein